MARPCRRGVRGDAVESFLTPATIGVMRAVKTAFDPHDRLNPGKTFQVRAGRVRIDPLPPRWARILTVES